MGVTSKGSYHSVDTGKYTTAPLFAIAAADRVWPVSSGVFIAMPVYRGGEVIEETIRSILDQDSRLPSGHELDGDDDPTVEVCRKYASDPRIDVVVQETDSDGRATSTGWLRTAIGSSSATGNRTTWPQPDTWGLHRELMARPDAAIAYTDVQWFGASFDRTRTEHRRRPTFADDATDRGDPIRAASWVYGGSMLPGGPPYLSPKTRAVRRSSSSSPTWPRPARSSASTGDVLQAAPRRQRLQRWLGFPDWRRN